jgi:hypothetical protein
MESVDVIILSNTADIKYYNMLKRCVDSIKRSDNINTRIILIESNKRLKGKDLKLPIDVIIVPDEKFNYNKFLNYGVRECIHNNICITNNDVYYYPNTISTLVSHLNVYDSVSPWDNNMTFRLHSSKGIYEGYKTRYHLTGYSFILKQSTLDAIGGSFDERFSFWYADDDYAMCLMEKGLRHAMIGDAEVFHEIEQSHALFDDEERKIQTINAKKIFDDKWKN